jgi:hypothetical protein
MILHFRYRFLLVCFASLFAFVGCRTKSFVRVQEVKQSSVPLGKGAPEDSVAIRLIRPYKVQIDREMNAVLIQSDAEAVKGMPEGTLGNLVCDLVLSRVGEYASAKGLKPDFVLLNNGGLRTSLPSGAITLGKVFELMPFENEVVAVTLSGAKTLECLHYIARSKGMPVAGLRAVLTDSTCAEIEIQGKPFDSNRSYVVITSDYLAYGGDKMRFFANPENYQLLGIKLRDLLVEGMTSLNREGKTLQPKKDRRLTYVR